MCTRVCVCLCVSLCVYVRARRVCVHVCAMPLVIKPCKPRISAQPTTKVCLTVDASGATVVVRVIEQSVNPPSALPLQVSVCVCVCVCVFVCVFEREKVYICV